MRGYLIAIEGGDGCGTTTHSGILGSGIQNWISVVPKLFLLESGFSGETIVMKSPSDSEFGQSIKRKFESGILKDPTAATMAFALDRIEQYENVTKKHLEEGKVVIFDRYIYSSLVHQNIQGASFDFIVNCNLSVPVPDLVFHLSADIITIKNRLLERENDLMALDESLDKQINDQIIHWNSVWPKAKTSGLLKNESDLIKVNTSLPKQDISNKLLSHASSRIIEKMLENSKKFL